MEYLEALRSYRIGPVGWSRGKKLVYFRIRFFHFSTQRKEKEIERKKFNCSWKVKKGPKFLQYLLISPLIVCWILIPLEPKAISCSKEALLISSESRSISLEN